MKLIEEAGKLVSLVKMDAQGHSRNIFDHVSEVMVNGTVFFRSLDQFTAKEQFDKRWSQSQ